MSAGEASFCKALFFGVVAEDLIFPFPRVQDAVIAEVHDCVTRVRRFVESEVDSSAIDGDARVDASTLGRMAEQIGRAHV